VVVRKVENRSRLSEFGYVFATQLRTVGRVKTTSFMVVRHDSVSTPKTPPIRRTVWVRHPRQIAPQAASKQSILLLLDQGPAAVGQSGDDGGDCSLHRCQLGSRSGPRGPARDGGHLEIRLYLQEATVRSPCYLRIFPSTAGCAPGHTSKTSGMNSSSSPRVTRRAWQELTKRGVKAPKVPVLGEQLAEKAAA